MFYFISVIIFCASLTSELSNSILAIMDELNLVSLPATCLLTIHLSSIETFLPLEVIRNLSSSESDNSLPISASRITRNSDNKTFEQQILPSESITFTYRDTLSNLASLSLKMRKAMLVMGYVDRVPTYVDTQIDHITMEQKEVRNFWVLHCIEDILANYTYVKYLQIKIFK